MNYRGLLNQNLLLFGNFICKHPGDSFLRRFNITNFESSAVLNFMGFHWDLGVTENFPKDRCCDTLNRWFSEDIFVIADKLLGQRLASRDQGFGHAYQATPVLVEFVRVNQTYVTRSSLEFGSYNELLLRVIHGELSTRANHILLKLHTAAKADN